MWGCACGDLRQTLHQFQAGENARNAASDKAFSRIGPQNDPLEGGKIPKMNTVEKDFFIMRSLI